MKILITAITLAIVSSASFADGFNPWENRNVPADHAEESTTENFGPIGFAPWNQGDKREIFSNQTDIAVESIEQNIFRPWS